MRTPPLAAKLVAAMLFLIALGIVTAASIAVRANHPVDPTSAPAIQKDDARARDAFLAAMPVLKHPRCLNCHSAGDYPRQSDDGHVHAQNVKRGNDGHGRYGQKCGACHQESNVAGLNMPPGAPNWHLPPARTPMIWEGKTPGEICRQIKDPKQNGNRTIAQIVEHVTSDKLVMWGWNPGEGRTAPPLGHDEFAGKIAEWARSGASCPE
jgi:hypothetical protein